MAGPPPPSGGDHPKSPRVILLSKTISPSHFHIFPPSLPALRVLLHSLLRLFFNSYSLWFPPSEHMASRVGVWAAAPIPCRVIPAQPCPPWDGDTGFCSSAFSGSLGEIFRAFVWLKVCVGLFFLLAGYYFLGLK